MSASVVRIDTPVESGVTRDAVRQERSALAGIQSRAEVALRAFFRLAEAWDLTIEQQRTLLGQPAKTTFYRWKNGTTTAVTLDLMERLSHLLGIYGALHRLYMEHQRADRWMKRPNDAPLFRGHRPIERLLGGRVADLYEVRRYLEGVAEPGF